jgi:hypothetical protein
MLLVAAACLCLSASAAGPEVPPEITRILDKARSGRNLTDAEQAALARWGEAMQAAGRGAEVEKIMATPPSGLGATAPEARRARSSSGSPTGRSAAASAAASQSSNPEGGACGCADMTAIDSRMKETLVAVQTYQLLLKRIPPDAPFDESIYSWIQKQVQDAVDDLYKPKAPPTVPKPYDPNAPPPPHKGPGGIEPNTCEITVAPGFSPCLKQSFLIHEEIHQKACEKYRAARSFLQNRLSLLGNNYVEARPLAETLREEITGYTTEFCFLKSLKKRLTRSCWDGEITFLQTFSLEQNRSGPYVGSAEGTKTESTHFHRTINANLTVKENVVSSGHASFDQVSTSDASVNATVRCRSKTNRQTYFDKPWSSKSHSVSLASKSYEPEEGHFHVDLTERGEVRLGFSLSGSEAVVDLTEEAGATGGCETPGPPTNRRNSTTMSTPDISYEVRDSVNPDADEMSGIKTETVPGSTLTTTISWSLKPSHPGVPLATFLDLARKLGMACP